MALLCSNLKNLVNLVNKTGQQVLYSGLYSSSSAAVRHFSSHMSGTARAVLSKYAVSPVYDIGLAQFDALKTMDELCPLCLKMGNNKRIKAVQINLEEAVWTCENEDCPWPFGYEPPVFLPRKVGFKHSSKWQIYKKVQKHVGPIPVSTELSLYTPPVTPSSDTASKESTKSEFSGDTNILEHLNSYAPKSSSFDNHASHEFTKKTQALNSCAEEQAGGICKGSPKAPIPQSIFDIDGKALPGDKIIIKDVCIEPNKKPDSPSALMEIVDIEKSEKAIETVLEACANEIGQKYEEKIEEEEAAMIVVEKVTGDVNSMKTIAQVTKIANATVDQKEMAASTKSVEPKDEDLPGETDSDSANKMKVEGSSMEIDESKSTESEVSPRRPTFDQSLNSKQHTMTTITLAGSLPITLSYDPTDLEEKLKDKVAETSPLVQDNWMENSQGEAVERRPIESPTDLVRKRVRPAAKRRAALIGKQYEKFSFSGLKKSPESKKGCSDVLSNERIKMEELKTVNVDVEHSPISDPDGSAEKIIRGASNQPLESLNSGLVDSTDSEKNGHDPIVENINLSVLDDFLLDGYQNATANLNDDWLESFFTTLDT